MMYKQVKRTIGGLGLFAGLLMLSGCCSSRSNLFQDGMECRKGQVADYDSMVFKSEEAEIYGQILKPDRAYGEKRPCVLIFHGFAGLARFDDNCCAAD